jgi:thioredoxin/glutathione reductase (selenoprotein)
MDSTMKHGETGVELDSYIGQHDYEYDLFVIGGGSGGMACAKVANDCGAKVAVADFVTPTPQGTTWKVGGTCVNVGCIPKKMMHFAAHLGESHHDQEATGWTHNETPKHDWEKMIVNVHNHIRGINFGYKSDMRKRGIKFYEKFATFVDAHTVELTDAKGKTEKVSAKYFVVAVGGRPTYPDIPGAKEHGITSDDIFWMNKAPGKTLVVGASYVALECAGFLHSFNIEAHIMVRSIFLRGFDQDMANKIGADMEAIGMKFIRDSVPTKIEKNEETGKLTCFYKTGEEEHTIEVDTVLFAIGRFAVTDKLNLDNAGLIVEKNGKFKTDKYEKTNVDNIYAIGDVLFEKLELTPTAIQTGRLLARRLFQGASTIMDFYDVPTTVFTPLEYG